MLIVGLTGGIASGKSLVAKVFKDIGAHIIDADKIVHELLTPGEQAWKEVLDLFGKEIQLPDKTIDRRKLGEIIFKDKDKRACLNNCLHPKVFEVYNAHVKRLCERARDAIIVFDAALLIETGFYKKMDKTVLVYAEPSQQFARLTERDRFTQEQANARIKSQMPLSEKRKHADYIIENTKTRKDTERQAREIFAKLKRDAEQAR